MSRKHIIIYTDGGADPNPGRGGYGVILTHGEHRKELCGGFARTTNNRMEMMAAIVGLEALKHPCQVTLFSDSKYLVDAIARKSVFKWRANGWWRTASERAKNADLWERLLAAGEPHEVQFRWVRGHAGNPLNERCDELAGLGRKGNLASDAGYVDSPSSAGAPERIEAGHACFQCGTPFVKRASRQPARPVKGQKQADWYLQCPGCGATLPG